MAKLKPCPFCGGTHVDVWHQYWVLPKRHDFAVHCYDCHFGLARKNTEAEAIEAWNRRVGDTND